MDAATALGSQLQNNMDDVAEQYLGEVHHPFRYFDTCIQRSLHVLHRILSTWMIIQGGSTYSR